MTPMLRFRRFGIAPDPMFYIEGWHVGSCAVQRFLPSHLPDCFVSVRLKVISLLVCSHASHVVGNALYLVSLFVTVSLSSHLTLCCLFWFFHSSFGSSASPSCLWRAAMQDASFLMFKEVYGVCNFVTELIVCCVEYGVWNTEC